MKNRIIIVGGGITGLTIGYCLSKIGKEVVILEKEKEVGGLARSFTYNDFTFDIGPHRFYTKDKKVLNFINEILKGEIISFFRNTSVYLFKKYYPWPLRPSILLNLPLGVGFRCSFDLLFNKRNSLEGDFKNYIITRYGPTLYNVFFKNYAEKFFQIPAEQIHSDWAKSGISYAYISKSSIPFNLLSLLRSTIYPKSLDTKFLYPKGGMGNFCKRLAESIKEKGGLVLVNSKVEGFKYRNGNIQSVISNKISWDSEKVIWTASIKELCRLLGIQTNLTYLSLILYFWEVRNINKKFQWCYFGEKDIVFNRISIPLLFDSSLAPKDKIGLCIEVTCKENDNFWNYPEKLVTSIMRDLKRIGLIKNIKEANLIGIERIPDAYPIYLLDYKEELKKIKNNLSYFDNLVLGGRSGLFWYNNMDDCIINGLKIAEGIISGDKKSLYV